MNARGWRVVGGLTAAMLTAGVVTAVASSAGEAPRVDPVATPVFTDEFTSFDRTDWSCEYTCPTIRNGQARFGLTAGIAPNNYGSWSKARYKGERYTSGGFEVSFSLTERPKKTNGVGAAVWWGVALWDDGPAADGSQFNEINFGYTTNQSFTDTQLRFESAKRGHDVSLKVDTGVDLYDGRPHTAKLEYDSQHVSFFLDGRLLETITDPAVIPTDPMDLILGTRVVTGSVPLTKGFTESIDWVKVYR